MGYSFINKIFNQFSFDHHNLHIHVVIRRMSRLNLQVCHVSLIVKRKICPVFVTLHALICCIKKRNVGFCITIILYKLIKMCIIDNVAVAQYQCFLFAPDKEVVVAAQCIQEARIQPDIFSCQERRQDMKSVVFAMKVPFFSAAKVVHQAVIVFLCDNADVLHSAVDHAADKEVDHPVSAGDRHCRDCTGNSQFTKPRVIFARIDKTHYILHHISSFLAVFSANSVKKCSLHQPAARQGYVLRQAVRFRYR